MMSPHSHEVKFNTSFQLSTEYWDRISRREIRKIFVTGNAAEEREREREEEREKKKKVRKHKPLGAQYSLVHSLLESFNKFI